MTLPRVAFVGCGFVAQQCHLPSFASLDSCLITHIADPCIDLRQNISMKYGVQFQFNDHMSLLTHQPSGFDAVVVTLPRKLTYKVVSDCVDYGKWVLTEKPLSLNSNISNSLLTKVKSSNVSVMTGYMRQHDEGVNAFRKIICDLGTDSITSIKAHSHMGNSYASPFGDIKGSQFTQINYTEQKFPEWLPTDQYFGFEQFLNVFSHITHLVEYIFDSPLTLISAQVNQNGEGLILCNILDIPVCFELLRGQQHEWREGISILTKTEQISLDLPPAFLRNVPSTVTRKEGSSSTCISQYIPNWSWAFRNQAIAFLDFISSTPSTTDVERALRQVVFAEKLFQHFI
ncbi:Gfo/Idh/MocA family protein [Synechococcus sp. KORDI-100]|uniref:Gfo/Idh/MocA family protein n=1 Tax=Synechococcus sp. KORDI-100 TaxID=1280380 RepID=UPI0008FFCE8E|nr:Gfo/Idh/MocA family oxidoreductase [Synechococcus sp. KORDI-100]